MTLTLLIINSNQKNQKKNSRYISLYDDVIFYILIMNRKNSNI